MAIGVHVHGIAKVESNLNGLAIDFQKLELMAFGFVKLEKDFFRIIGEEFGQLAL